MNGRTAAWILLACVMLANRSLAGTVTTLEVIEANGDVSLDSAGDIYAADFGDPAASPGPRFIWKLSPTGAFDPVIFATDIIVASGNDFDSQDNLFQSNFGGDEISKIDPSGVVTTFSNSVRGPVGNCDRCVRQSPGQQLP